MKIKKLKINEREHLFAVRAFFLLISALVIFALVKLYTETLKREAGLNMPACIRLSSSVADGGEAEPFSEIMKDFSEILPEGFAYDEDNPQSSVGFTSLISNVVLTLSDSGGEILSYFALLIGVCMLFSLAEGGLVTADMSGAMSAGISSVLGIPIFSVLYNLIFSAEESIRRGCEFFSGLIPIATGITALGGAGVTAATEGAGMSLALAFVSNVLLSNLLPICTLMFSLSLVSSFDTGSGLSGFTSGIKNLFSFGMGLVCMLIPATLALQSVISTAKDSMALRGVKYAIGGMLPVVGGTVSSVFSSLVSGAGMMSGAVGGVSVAVIVFIFASPVIELLLYRLALRVAVSFLELVGVTYGRRIFSSAMSALDCLIAVLTMSGVVFLLETVIFTRAVVTV